MDSFLVKAIPSRTKGVLPESFPEERSVVIDVMFTGDIENLGDFAVFQELSQRIELSGIRQVGQIACVKQKLGRFGQSVNPGNGFAKCSDNIGIRRFIKSNMTIADLDKIKFSSRELRRIIC